MDQEFHESRTILPRNLIIIMTAALAVSWLSMIFTKFFYYSGIPDWTIYVFGAVCAIAIVISVFAKYSADIYGDRIDVTYLFRTTSIPKEQIIDTKVGDIDIIKNYSDWTLKGVKYKTFSAVGEERAIGLKVTGKRVFYLTTSDPEAMAALLPKEEKEAAE